MRMANPLSNTDPKGYGLPLHNAKQSAVLYTIVLPCRAFANVVPLLRYSALAVRLANIHGTRIRKSWPFLPTRKDRRLTFRVVVVIVELSGSDITAQCQRRR